MKKSLLLLLLFTSILMACSNSDSTTESRYTTSAEETEVTYICPMDCENGKTYEKEGECPVCGMALDESEEED